MNDVGWLYRTTATVTTQLIHEVIRLRGRVRKHLAGILDIITFADTKNFLNNTRHLTVLGIPKLGFKEMKASDVASTDSGR